MKKVLSYFYEILPHLLFALLILLIYTPCIPKIEDRFVFTLVAVLFEINLIVRRKKTAIRNISIIVFAFFDIWTFVTTKFETSNTMLYPVPQNVFGVFATDYLKILEGLGSSLWLLSIGFFFALTLGIGLGLVVGWFKNLREALFPIAKVVSTIPPIVYIPYAVALLPSFKVAQIFVIFCSIFWGTFMSMIINVSNIDRKILDSAKTLNITSLDLLLNVLLPYSLPGVVKGLTVSLASSFMVLTAAELIGASSGLGWYVKYYSDFADYKRAIAGIIMIGVVVTILSKLIEIADKAFIKWK